MQFLHELRLSAGGGVVRAVLDLSVAISRLGHRVTLLTLDPLDAPADWPRVRSTGELAIMPIGTTPAVFVPDGSNPGRRFRGRKVRRQVNSLVAGADVLHVHGLWEWCNVQAMAVARRAGVPVAVTAHGMLDDWSMDQGGFKKRLFLRLVLRRALASNVHLHFTAEAERQQASQWIGDAPSSVIPYVLDVAPFLECEPPATRDCTVVPHVLLLSRLHPKKGVERLIDAAGVITRQGLAVRWTIAGPTDEAYLASLRRRVDDRGLSDCVAFPGMVSGQAKIDLYRSADLFVLPTSQENFGLVLIEAMASGVPVITTRGVDIWRELQAAGAVIVDPDDGAGLAEAVSRLLQNSDERERRGREGRQWVETTFGGDTVARRFETLYLGLSAARA